MTITVAVLAGLTIGLTIAAVVAGLVLMEHPRRWIVCVRLSGELHRRLREAARDHMVQPQSGDHQSIGSELRPAEWGSGR
jgi:hypothetical protein